MNVEDWILYSVSVIKQTRITARACEHSSQKICLKLWKNLCNSLNSDVETNFLKCFHKNSLFQDLFSLSLLFHVSKTWNILLNRLSIVEILWKLVDCWFKLAEEFYRIPCLHQKVWPSSLDIQLADYLTN